MILRPYQSRALDELFAWFERHPDGNPVVEACVGAGKSVLIAELCRRVLAWPEQHVLMVVASRELCAQNAERLLAVWPEAPVGVYSAGLGSRTLGAPITYATIGSVWKRAHELGPVSLVLIDECHQMGESDGGMYRTLLRELARFNPRLRVVGWTGTAFRGDGVWLSDAEEPIFTHVAARVAMRELLEAGYLAPLTVASTRLRMQAEGVAMRAGDFVVSQLAERLDRDDLVQAAASELVALGTDRRRWLVYCVTVAHAHHVCAALRARGVDAAVVTGETQSAQRDATIAAFRAGALRAIVNVAVLTTGFDVPAVDLIALMRNTRSPVLYTQIAGRGMRIAESKADCLWCDFTDTTAVLGPVDAIRGRARRQSGAEGRDAPHKVCDECGSQNATAVLECTSCGAAFPEPERVTHRAVASSAQVLSAPVAERVTDYPVSRIEYRRHQKDGSPDSMRVEYYSGLRRVVCEWVCVEHTGYARAKAEAWWAWRSADAAPYDVGDALEVAPTLRRPAAIRVNETGRWPELIGVIWDDPHGTDRDPRRARQAPAGAGANPDDLFALHAPGH